jgi:hypothetical protein
MERWTEFVLGVWENGEYNEGNNASSVRIAAFSSLAPIAVSSSSMICA